MRIIDWSSDVCSSDLKISEQMAQHATRAESHQLWRTAAASIEALLGRTLENSLDLKRLFGRVSQQMKQIADHGEDVSAASSRELSLQLLFIVGRSRDRGARVQALRSDLDRKSTRLNSSH